MKVRENFKQICVIVPDELHQQIKHICIERHMTLSRWMEKAILLKLKADGYLLPFVKVPDNDQS